MTSVFVSYSHLDKKYLRDDSLLGFLSGLKKDGVEFWWDEAITVGNRWDEEIKSRIVTTDIALILVSQAFLDSAYCKNVEISGFLEQNESRGLVIFPIMLSRCEWDLHEWLKTRQFLPTGNRNIENDYRLRGKRIELFYDIRQHMRRQLEHLSAKNVKRHRRKVPKSKQGVTPTAASSTKPRPVKKFIKGRDGKQMILIPRSDFLMGSDERVVYVDDFYIDKYPVTNAEYKKFLDSLPRPLKKRQLPRSWGDKYPKLKPHYPVSGVGFNDAKKYAEYVDKRLPTEREWEKAARGTAGREYPWGNRFDKNKCNTCESGIDDTTPVPQYPDGASPYGVLDMAGNVWEWVNDWANEVEKIIKGGSYKHDRDFALCSSRDSHDPNAGRNTTIGFRCVMDPR
jgi:formylglycine-generating enzyme required for sulfatase activity